MVFLKQLLKNKRFLLTILMIFGVAGYFWTQSRYPQLDEKMMMGADTPVQAIGFDVYTEMPEDPTIVQKIYVNTINWMWTNRKGMGFGLILGALMMNLLPFLNGVQFRSRIANSGLGIVMGAPLGLCVNCSTPVAHGLHESGARTETMLATMMSSPTLNVIVLTMLFAMFPPWLAFMKIGMTLLFILAVIPLITRFLKPEQTISRTVEQEVLNATAKTTIESSYCEDNNEDCIQVDPNENWGQAILGVVKSFFVNLWYILKITVPLMILAGFLGAVIVSFVPIEQAVGYLPEGRFFSWGSMIALALFGLFLPSPMTFDVIVAAILYNAGTPIKYVAILLFTLGIFSVYPFMTIWRRISRQMAFSIVAALTFSAVVIGVMANRYQMYDMARQRKEILEPFLAAVKPPTLNKIDRANQGVAASELLPQLKQSALIPEPFLNERNISVSRLAFNSPRPAEAEDHALMRRIDQKEFGITEHDNISPFKMTTRQSLSRGIASGDVNRDGWTDFAVSSDAGFALFLNKHGTGFVQQRIDISRFDDKFVIAVTLVDLNNDGWLDFWFTTLEDGNFVIYSREGNFAEENMKRIMNQKDAAATGSTGFGDLDRDGKLDIVIGNVSYPGKADEKAPFTSVRNIWLNQESENQFSLRNLSGADGESLTTFLSDINGDGNLDLLTGNDLGPPDVIYYGDGKGGFRLIKKSDGIIPHTTTFTMSITSADLDNDLVPELFFGSISKRDQPKSKGGSRKMIPGEICAEITDDNARSRCEKFYNFREKISPAVFRDELWLCNNLTDSGERDACIALNIVQKATHTFRNESLCNLPPGWDYLEKACRAHFADKITKTKEEIDEFIPQVATENVLLKRNENGNFVDKVREFGLDKSGWTWNAKFADLDNDGWQDLYVANGWIGRLATESNYFYRNIEGNKFEDITEESGLSSNLNTTAYTYIDIDNDGDLDIITSPIVGPLQIFINQTQPKRSIAFEINDTRGNFYGIGSKIIINYGDGKHQMREIQSSGGYLSYDAPVAFFGLGDEETVKSVEIRWSTGERTVIEKEFKAGARYVLAR